MPLALWLLAGGFGLWYFLRPRMVPAPMPSTTPAPSTPSTPTTPTPDDAGPDRPVAVCPPAIRDAEVSRLRSWAQMLIARAQANPRSVDPRVMDCIATALQQRVELATEADTLRIEADKVRAALRPEEVPQGPIPVPTATATGRLVSMALEDMELTQRALRGEFGVNAQTAALARVQGMMAGTGQQLVDRALQLSRIRPPGSDIERQLVASWGGAAYCDRNGADCYVYDAPHNRMTHIARRGALVRIERVSLGHALIEFPDFAHPNTRRRGWIPIAHLRAGQPPGTLISTTGQVSLSQEDLPRQCGPGESFAYPDQSSIRLDPRAYPVVDPARGFGYCVSDATVLSPRTPVPTPPLPLTRRFGRRPFPAPPPVAEPQRRVGTAPFPR